MRAQRISRKGNILRRLEELEARWTDGSGLVPHSAEWLEFWQQELDKSVAGKEHMRLPLEAARAIMQAAPDVEDDDPVGEAA